MPLSFSDRAALDRDSAGIAAADREILEVLSGGGTVWELAIGRLDYMMAVTDRLEQRMQAAVGPPADFQSFARAAEEDVKVRVWRAAVSGAADRQ